jgi:flagellar basal-body rod protein FlgG
MQYDEYGSPLTDDIPAQLGVYNFDNPLGLESRSNARYVVSANSGAAVAEAMDTNVYQIIPQTLERSNVELAREMTEIINAQRAFQMNSRVVTTADAIADELNNLR